MNEVRSYGPENQGWGRRYGISDAAVGTLASDLFPFVDSSFRGVDEELLALQGGRMRASAPIASAAVAARFSAVGLANPANSGVIGVVEAIRIVMPGVTVTFSIRRQAAAVSATQGAVQGSALDSRLTELASMRLLATDEAALVNYGTSLTQLTAVTNPVMITDIPYVLAPNSTLWVANHTLAEAITVTFQWRQRRLEDAENAPV